MKLLFAGGLNELQNPTLLECIEGYNFDLGLRQSKLVPRKPFDLSGTATNGLSINGLMQLVKRDNTETTLVQAGSKVYLWDGGSTFTDQGNVTATSKLRDTTWALGDYLVITDISKSTVVKKWDGTTLSTLTTGLATDLYAKYGLVYQNRMWLFNVKTSTDTPHLMVASAFEDPTSYDTTTRRGGPTTAGGGTFTTGLEAFYMLSPDLKPINGAFLINKELVISTQGGRMFKLTGTTAATYAWVEYYQGSALVSDEAGANIGNDLAYMKAGGNIDLLSATQTSGDVATDDVSRWIQTTVKDLTGAICVYDQKNQKVLFFVSNKVLVLFKDLLGGELSPWSVYKTAQSFAFNTSAAKFMKMPGTQVYTVYFGDSAGRVFDLNGSGSGDAGSSNIAVLRKTRFIPNGEGGLDVMRKILHGIVTYRRIYNSCDLTLSFDWGDEYNISSSVVSLKGAPSASAGVYYGGGSYYSGTAYFSQGSAYANKISSQRFSPTGKGSGFFLSLSLDTTTNFQVDSVEF